MAFLTEYVVVDRIIRHLELTCVADLISRLTVRISRLTERH